MIIVGALRRSAGRVLFDGKPIRRPARERMMVFQQPALFPG
jgi:ABC-type nitrate/sulfonate/bicarbonate transport system ATPase subunit